MSDDEMIKMWAAAAMRAAFPSRPTGSKSCIERKVTYRQLSRHSWRCYIRQFSRVKQAKGTTKHSAYINAVNSK
jgi:hypothetical protein